MSLADQAAPAPAADRVTIRGTALAGVSGRRPILYVALASALFLAMVGHTLNEKWASPDFWVYLGAVREFAHHPLDPANPLMVGRDADPYLSPYTWLLGVTSRVTGVDGIQVLAAAGLVNLVLALAGLYRLVTALSPRWLAPPLTLVFTLFAWGTPPWRWAGFLNANSIGTVLPLGSTFATALAYFALAAIWRWLRSGSRADLVLVGVTTPVIITCHPFTATWTAAIGLGFVVAGADRGNRLRVIRLAGVAAGAAAVAVAWPFYPVVDLPVASGGFRAINEAVFHQVIPRTFLALPGVLALWWRYRQRRRDPLVLGFACVTTVYAIGWILDRPTLGRVLPAVVLILHVALADLVAHLLEDARPARHRSVTIVVASVAIAVGVVTTAAGTVRALPRALLPASLADRRELRSLVDGYRPIGDRIQRRRRVPAAGAGNRRHQRQARRALRARAVRRRRGRTRASDGHGPRSEDAGRGAQRRARALRRRLAGADAW